MVFLTGDLGFGALEQLRDVMGDRFINMGVAEQNMVSVGAALAHEGLEVWIYSIAPFVYGRPFEQIRNDVSFHGLPVNLIGNGGGYGYGVMGPTHHAIEDYAVLLTLPSMSIYSPVFASDVSHSVTRAGESSRPSYIRLGRSEMDENFELPPYSPWRQFSAGDGPVIISTGSIAGSLIKAVNNKGLGDRLNLWVVTELHSETIAIPAALTELIASSRTTCVVEEHVRNGGLGSLILMELAQSGSLPSNFVHRFALSHQFDLYGSQDYMRIRSGLNPDEILDSLEI